MTVAKVLLALLCFVQFASAQKTITITNSEPGIITLGHLREQSDIVALVKVISGDTENYDVALYKAEVVTGYKGAAAGQTIFFGPYLGTRLGWEYLLFLRTNSAPLAPKKNAAGRYGTVRYSSVFNEGYSSMETEYQCIFDGKDVENRCDYGIRVCTDYIVLPKDVPVAPPMSDDQPFGCRWVRKSILLSLLAP
jgi:hypothetical protein